MKRQSSKRKQRNTLITDQPPRMTTTIIPTPDDVQKVWDDAYAKEKRVLDEAEKDDHVAVEELVAKERDELVEMMTVTVCRRLYESTMCRTIFVTWPKYYFCSDDISLLRTRTRMALYKSLIVDLFQTDVIPKFEERGWGLELLSVQQGGMDILLSNEAPVK